MKKHDLTCC